MFCLTECIGVLCLRSAFACKTGYLAELWPFHLVFSSEVLNACSHETYNHKETEATVGWCFWFDWRRQWQAANVRLKGIYCGDVKRPGWKLIKFNSLIWRSPIDLLCVCFSLNSSVLEVPRGGEFLISLRRKLSCTADCNPTWYSLMLCLLTVSCCRRVWDYISSLHAYQVFP